MAGKASDFIQMRLTGADETAKVLRGLQGEMGKKILDKAVRQEVQHWAELAKSVCKESDLPHWVGRLKSGHRQQVSPGNLKRNILVRKLRIESAFRTTDSRFGIVIPAIAYYWRFIELGTRKFFPGAGRPFLRPAFDTLAPGSLQHVADEAKRFIRVYLEKNNRAKVSRYTARKLG